MTLTRLLSILCLILGGTLSQAAVGDPHKEHKTAFLGVSLGHSPEHDANGENSGVKVLTVVSKSAADKAGVEKGDLIVSIDGAELTSHKTLVSQLEKYSPEDEITLRINRNGAELDIGVVLGQRAKHNYHFGKKWMEVIDEHRPWFGVSLETLNPQLAEFFGVDHGVLITKVTAESPAAAAGLNAGDIVLEWDDQLIKKDSDIKKAIRAAEKDDNAEIVVNRKGERMTFSVAPGSLSDQFKKHGVKFRNGNGFRFEMDGDFNFDFMPNIRLEGLDNIHVEHFGDNLKENLHKLHKELNGLEDQLKQIKIETKQKEEMH